MNTIKRRVTFVVLVLSGIACVVTAIVVAPLAAILGPLGGVFLAGAFGMFQSVFQPTNDNEGDKHGATDAEQAHAQDVHVDHNIYQEHPNINILFQYNQYGNEPLADPRDIIRPHRPLNLV